MLKHRRITDELRALIASGALKPGEPLPSEHTLMSQYGVSRGTVRQAIAALRVDGVISGSRGKSPRVGTHHLTQPLSELVGFSAWVRALGMRPSSRVISFASTNAGDQLAQELNIPSGAPVYQLERVRYADQKPLMIERTTFIERVGTLLVPLDLATQSIYDELARDGVTFAWARHAISAIPATRADARLLGVAARTALLRIQRKAFSSEGTALEWSDDRYLGDHIVFAIENKAGEASVSRDAG